MGEIVTHIMCGLDHAELILPMEEDGSERYKRWLMYYILYYVSSFLCTNRHPELLIFFYIEAYNENLAELLLAHL